MPRRPLAADRDGAAPMRVGRDIADLQPAVHEAVELLAAQGDSSRVHRLVLGVNDPGEQVDLLIRVVGLCPDRRALGPWLQAFGRVSAVPWAALAYRHLQDGWAGLSARDLRATPGIEAFRRELRAAEGAAWCGHVADPQSPLPWAAASRSARGLGVPLEEQIARYDRLSQLGAIVPDADDALLRTLTATGGGSDDLMFAYARRLADDPTADATRASLPCLAHLEKLSQLGGAAADEYRHLESNRRAVAGHVEATFLRVDATPAYAHPMALNRATVAASQFDLPDLARRGHRLIDGRYLELPWAAFGVTADDAISDDLLRLGLADA